MAKSVGGIAVDMTLDSGKFTDGMKKAEKSLKEFGDNAGSLASRIPALFSQMTSSAVSSMGRLGPAAAGAFAVMQVGKAIEVADAMSDLSDAVGISAGSLLELEGALIAAGGKLGDMEKIVNKFNANVGKALGGDEGLQNIFKELGVFLTDAEGKARPLNDVLRETFEELAKIENASERAAKAQELMGKAALGKDFTKIVLEENAAMTEQLKKVAELQSMIDSFSQGMKQYAVSFTAGLVDIVKAAADKLRGLLDWLTSKFPTGMKDYSNTDPNANWYQEADTSIATIDVSGASNKKPRPTDGGYGTTKDTKPSPTKAVSKGPDLSGKLRSLEQQTAELDRQAYFKGLFNDLERDSILLGNDVTAQRKIELNYADRVSKLKAEYLNNVKAEPALASQYLTIFNKQLEGEQQALTWATEKLSIMKEQEAVAQASADAAKAEAKAQQDAVKIAMAENMIDEARQLGRDANRELGFSMKGDYSVGAQIRNQRSKEGSDFIQQMKSLKSAIEDLEMGEQQRLIQEYTSAWDEATETMAIAAEQITKIDEVNSSVMGNLNSALDNFVDTGKFKMKDFAASVIRDIVKIQLKASASNLITSLFGGNPIGGFMSKLGAFGGARAEGGPVSAGKTYLVGERGPELFTPGTSGGITPNHALGQGGGTTVVNYNISAVDAKSFQQLVLSNPQAIYAATMGGQKKMQTGGRV